MKKWFWFSVISFLISSAAILFMPLGSFEPEGNRLLAYSLAGVFWLFFIMGFVFLIPISRQRRSEKQYKYIKGFTFIRFFNNKPAMLFDAMLIISIITLVISLFVARTLPGWVTLAGTFGTVFFLEMHGLFNGKNFEYLVDKKRFSRETN